MCHAGMIDAGIRLNASCVDNDPRSVSCKWSRYLPSAAGRVPDSAATLAVRLVGGWLDGDRAGIEQTAINDNVSLRELIIFGLWPFKMTVFDFPGGGDAQAFSFQLATSNEANTRALLASVKDPHLDLLKRAVRRKLPEAVFEQRWQFFRTEAFAGQWVRSKVFRITEQGDWKWSPAIERDYLLRFHLHDCFYCK